MKQYNLLYLGMALFLSLWSCRDQSPGYLLTGNIGNNPGEKVLLKRQVDLEKWIDADSVIVNRDGTFQFKGELPYPEFVYIYFTQKQKFVRFFLENSTVSVTSNYDSVLLQPMVIGSATQDTFRHFRNLIQQKFSVPMHLLGQRYQQAASAGDSIKMTRILHQRDSLLKAQQSFEKSFIVNHSNSVLAPFMISISYMNYSPEELDSLMSILDPSLDSSLYVRIAKKRIRNRLESLPGHPAPDFSLPDSNGKNYSLKELTGKYLLLNFWASWNPHSRNISRQLVPVYNRYHDLGFDILGLSLDTKRDEWKAVVRKDHLPWVQVIETSGPRGEVPVRYNISGFPQMILIDPEGTILARVDSIPELEEWLSSIFE